MRGRWIGAIAIVGSVIAACGGSDRAEPKPSDDLTVTQCTRDAGVIVHVVNDGSGRASYRYTIVLKDAQGAEIDRQNDHIDAVDRGDDTYIQRQQIFRPESASQVAHCELANVMREPA